MQAEIQFPFRHLENREKALASLKSYLACDAVFSDLLATGAKAAGQLHQASSSFDCTGPDIMNATLSASEVTDTNEISLDVDIYHRYDN